MAFEDFFDVPQFDKAGNKSRLVNNLDMLKSMSVQEQTLYKKYYEVNHEFKWAANKASVLKAKIWRPTDIFNKDQTIAEIEALEPTWKIVNGTDEKESEEWLLYRVFCHSFNYDQNPGRLLRMLVVDKSTQQVLGISSLASDVISITCRDEWIGWDRETKIKHGMLNNIAIATTILATQPFGYNFLGGKLIASMLCSKVIRDLWESTYNNELVGITTTALYGSHSMYQRIPYWKELGKTKGKIGLKPDNNVYEIWHEYIKTHYPEEYLKITRDKDGINPSTGIKQRILDRIYRELDISKNAYVHGFERGVYFAPLYENTKEFLNRKIDKNSLTLSKKLERDLDGIIDWWRPKAIQRYLNLFDQQRLKKDILFYNRIIGQDWNTVKKLYIEEIGR